MKKKKKIKRLFSVTSTMPQSKRDKIISIKKMLIINDLLDRFSYFEVMTNCRLDSIIGMIAVTHILKEVGLWKETYPALKETIFLYKANESGEFWKMENIKKLDGGLDLYLKEKKGIKDDIEPLLNSLLVSLNSLVDNHEENKKITINK